MRLMNVIIGLLVILFLLLAGTAALVLMSLIQEESAEKPAPLMSVLETGTVGDHGYAVFNYRGEGNVTLIAYDRQPKRDIIIINDSEALQATRFQDFVEDIRQLEDYGFSIAVSDSPTIGDAIYIVPTGAIPSYVLFSLKSGLSNGTIIYVGEKDLLLSRGVKQQDWYDELTAEQRKRLIVHEGTPDDFIESGGSLSGEALYQPWNQEANSTVNISRSGLHTSVVPMDGANYLRVIYELEGLYGIFDSPRLAPQGGTLSPTPAEAYPWEKSSLRFSLNQTNGTAYLSVTKDGKVIEREILRRVSSENVFLETFEFTEPGEYILTVEDNDGVIASGLLHVYDLRITPSGRSGVTYLFDVTKDGEPLEGAEAFVSVGNSTQSKRAYVSDGQIAVGARLDAGVSVFNFEMLGGTLRVPVRNDQTSILDVYIKYGIPGLALVVLVYFGARITRRPSYRLRFGEAGTYLRQEIRVPFASAVDAFRKIRHDMNLGASPITPHEFSISIKRYLTNGADVTEGNVEEILNKLVKGGALESHRNYYQFKDEGDVRRNTLRRMIREKLIQSGTMFSEKGDKFVTKDYEIGFFGESFTKKGIIVVDDVPERNRLLSGLGREERARLDILRTNGMIEIVPIDRLDDVL